MPFITTTDNTSLYYKDWGNPTGQPVIFIHGWPLNADMWEYQAPALAAQGFRCIAYDRRGFGRSDQPWNGNDYTTLAADLHTLIETLKLTNVTLVGFSMGGGEVARYLGTHQRVSKAVFISSVVPYLVQTTDNPDGVDRDVFNQMVEGLQADRPHFLNDFGKKFFGAGLLNFSISADILQWAQGLALMASPKATIDCVRAFSETDFRNDVKTMASSQIPTLIIHGTSDQTVPAEASSERLAQMLPHAEYLTYDGAPHALFFTEKDKLNADLLNFLQAVPHINRAAA